MSGTVPSIVRTGSLTLGPAADPLVYHALYLMVYPIVQWSLGSLMLRGAARDIMAHCRTISQQSAPEPSSGGVTRTTRASIKEAKMLADPFSESLMTTSLMPSVYKMRGILDGDEDAIHRVAISQNPLSFTPRDYPRLAATVANSPRTPGTGLDVSEMSQMDISDIFALSSQLPPATGSPLCSPHRGGITTFATPPPTRVSLYERAVVATAARMSHTTTPATNDDKLKQSVNESLLPTAPATPVAAAAEEPGQEQLEWRSGVKALGLVLSSLIALMHHLLTPPTVGAILGIIVGGVPSLYLLTYSFAYLVTACLWTEYAVLGYRIYICSHNKTDVSDCDFT